MSRQYGLLMAVFLAIGTVGCTHCDTCDDFPTPCSGPGCGGQGIPFASEVPMGPPIYQQGPVTSSMPPATVSTPATTSEPAPSTGPSPFAPAPGDSGSLLDLPTETNPPSDSPPVAPEAGITPNPAF